MKVQLVLFARFVCVAAACLTVAASCFSQCNPHPFLLSCLPDCANAGRPPQIAPAEAKIAAQGSIPAAMDAARRRLWKALPSGPGYDAAESELSDLLLWKDVYYLQLVLSEGVPGRMNNLMNIFSSGNPYKTSLSGDPKNVDGGIRPSAYPLFVEWVNALRREGGADKEGDIVANPMILGRAITVPSNRRKAYERARNWSELQASGLDLAQYRDPKCEKEKGGAAAMYALRLIEAQVTLQLANSGTADTADPYPVTKKMYSLLASNTNIGEKELVAAGDAVLHTPKNSDGKIMSASGRELTDPYVQLLTLLTENSIRNYVFILLNPDAEGSRKRGTFTANWEESVASYHQLVAKYGETAVLAAAAKIKAAPKTPQGYIVGDYQSTGLLDTFHTMLKDPKAIVPDGQIHRYEVSAFDPQWLGKRVILHGTVSRVHVDTTLRQPYIIINFKESPDGAVLAYSIDTDVFISRFGAGFSGLVGKEVDLQGDLGVFREAKGALRLLYESRSQFQINVKVLSNP